jgi:hypothetical protein
MVNSPAPFTAGLARRGTLPFQETGVVYVSVLDRDSHDPVQAGVVLSVQHQGKNITVRAPQVDAAGQATLYASDLAEREIFVFADGYGRTRKMVFPSTAPTSVAIELAAGGAVSGIVRSDYAAPLASAEIKVVYSPLVRRRGEVRSRLQGDFHRGRPRTGSDGRFEILDIDPQRVFSLEVTHPEKGASIVGPFSLAPGQRIDNLQVALW